MFTANKYVKAQSLQEAYELNQSKTSIIIGGMMWLRLSNRTFQTAIDLCDLGLDIIEENDEEFSIGAMASLRQLEKHPGLNSYSDGAVADAVRDIIGVQFRNGATVGGSLFGRFGFSDVLTVFLAMESFVELYNGGIVPLSDFAVMPRDNDILIRLIVKKKPGAFIYQAMRIQKTDYPVLTCAMSKIDGMYRISIGARPAAARLITIPKDFSIACDSNSEATNVGKSDNGKSDNFESDNGQSDNSESEIVAQVIDQLDFGSNNRGSEEYRKHLAKVFIGRGLDYINKKEEA